MDDPKTGGYQGGNRLIDSLPPADRRRVAEFLTPMTADEPSQGIARSEPITALYFPIDAVFSVIVELGGGDCYEVDTVGRESFIGGELLFGAHVASRSVICQIGGRFAQMPADAFVRLHHEVEPFRRAVDRALHLQWFRSQQTVACNFAHTLMQRCARWILLSQDEVGRPSFKLRGEYLSMMLGVHRRVVIEPLAALEGMAAIRYADEEVTVVSQRKLRDAACECYVAPLEYAKRLSAHPRARREAR